MHSLEYAIFPHEHEISLAGSVDDLFRARTRTDEPTDFVRETEDFIDTDTTLVAGHPTGITSFRSMKCIGILLGSESSNTDILEHPLDDIDLARICLICLDTVWTEATDEALSNDDIETRSEDIVRDAHIHEAFDRLSGTLRMERREDEVSRHRCLHRDRRRFEISDLTDHDDIWILTKESLQSTTIRVVFLLIDFTLDHSLQFIFDRIFEGDDLAFRSIEGREC